MTDNLAPIVLARKESASVDAALKRMEAMRAATPASPSAPVAAAAPSQPAASASAKGPTVGGVVRDVAQGAVETMTLNPQRNALLYGVVSAVDEFFDTTLDLALYPFGASHKDVDALLDPIAGTFSLEGPQSNTGKVVSSVAQFMSGMMVGSKALTSVGAAKKLGSFGTSVVAGAAADTFTFDEQQKRLSGLIKSVPALQNPVTEYLAGDPGDSIVELKFKQALEGLALGGLTEGLYQGVRAIKRGMAERAAARAATPEGQAATATAGAKAAPEESLVPELTDRDWMTLGGKPDAPLFEVTPQSQERTASLIKMAEERWGPDSVPGLLAEVRKPQPAPQGLMSWLRSKGGLQESSGELSTRGLIKRLPGLVNNKGGMKLDDAALAATEAGYIGTPGAGRASIDDLLAAIDRENAGTPVWSSADQARIDRRETVDQFGRMLDELGLDINAPDAEIEAALRAKGTARPEAPPTQSIDDALADNPDLGMEPRTAEDIAAENAAGALDVSPDDMLGRIKIGNKVGNINLNRIGGTDDLRAVIRQTAEALDAQTPLATVRQGEDVAREMADRLLLDSDSMAKLLSGQSVRGQAFTREEIIATGELVTQTGKSIEKLARKVATGGASDTEKLALHRAVAFQGSVLNLVSGQAREAGRALQSFQTIVKGNKAAMVALRDATAQHGTTEALARALNSLPPQGQAAMARAAAQGGGLFHRGMEAVVEYWLAGLLWGPRTHAVNVTSNALTAFGGTAERYVAGRIGSGVAREEGAAMLYGQLTSFREALRAAGHGFRTGQPLLDAGSKIEQVFKPKLTAAHLGVDENTVLGRALDGLGEVQRMSFRALTAADEFFKVMARNGEKHAQAYRIAASEGLDGDRMAARVAELVQAPTAEMQAAMNDYARYVTFQQPAGPITAKLQQLVQTHPLLRILLPFIQTPTNIFKYVGERTPLAVMSRKVRDEISAGGARRDLALAKISMGSMVMATAADYASQGLITGAPPGDPQLRQALERTGVLPYSVKVGDSWVQVNRLDPMGMTIGLAADFSQIMRSWVELEGLALPDADLAAVRQTMIDRGADPATVDADLARLEQETGLDPMKVAAAVTVAVQENVLNKSYLQGLSDIFEILAAPSTAQSAGLAKRWVQQFGASLLPVSGALRQAESIVDPNLRYADTMMEAWRSMVPGLSSSLPVVPDLWGQPRQHINSSLVPIAIRDAKLSPVDSEIVRLKAEVSMPTKQIGEVRLKPDEYVRFVELAGRDIRDQATGLNAKQYLDAVVSDNAEATGEPDERSVVMPLGLPAVASIAQMYKAGTDGPSGSKATIIKSIVSGFREAARAEMLRSDPGLAAVIEARKRIEAEKKAGAR